MPFSPENIKGSCKHAGLTHFASVHSGHDFRRVLRHSAPSAEDHPERETRSPPFPGVPKLLLLDQNVTSASYRVPK